MIIANKIAEELQVQSSQITTVIKLLEEGATVPFIARYRKEATGGLSDTQLRQLDDRLGYFQELQDRQQTILKSIEAQNKLTPALKQTILNTDNKSLLEDLYLPYKPKRRTKAQIAREAGLVPLAEGLLQQPQQDPQEAAKAFLNPEKDIVDVTAALAGAKQILMETFSEQAELLGQLREYLWQQGQLHSQVIADKQQEGSKFADYFNHQEAIAKIPSHRALALFRGRKEGILRVNLVLEEDEHQYCIAQICQHFAISQQQRPAGEWLLDCVKSCWTIKLMMKLELELLMRVREAAEEEAIKVFAQNLHHLLMAAPAGTRVTLGLDPGLRTGVKVVVVDRTGALLAHTTIFPHAPRHQWDRSLMTLAALCQQHQVDLVSIGNGTASRETDKLVTALINAHPQLKLTKVVISEAGASVYSASELAAKEFPDLDVTFRGAVSIARRLQDPLAELVKIEPKAIGVGQYQHDVNQVKLGKSLRGVMEDCVNKVGVDLNTASVPLLTSVAGLNENIATHIVQYRHQQGAFTSRQQLLSVPRLGEKTFEQAAGFLRIQQGDNPLDCSAVHPEAYPVVEKILKKTGKTLSQIMANTDLLRHLNPADFVDEKFGLPTVVDIIQELEKPGRDPRPIFKTVNFKEGVENLQDLRENMRLEGVITNVTNFGAFVDIGVHQDGLIHKSQLTKGYVSDPSKVVKVGDIVTVKVLEVDLERRRVSLTRRLEEDKPPAVNPASSAKTKANAKQPPASNNIMAQAFARAKKK